MVSCKTNHQMSLQLTWAAGAELSEFNTIVKKDAGRRKVYKIYLYLLITILNYQLKLLQRHLIFLVNSRTNF